MVGLIAAVAVKSVVIVEAHSNLKTSTNVGDAEMKTLGITVASEATLVRNPRRDRDQLLLNNNISYKLRLTHATLFQLAPNRTDGSIARYVQDRRSF